MYELQIDGLSTLVEKKSQAPAASADPAELKKKDAKITLLQNKLAKAENAQKKADKELEVYARRVRDLELEKNQAKAGAKSGPAKDAAPKGQTQKNNT